MRRPASSSPSATRHASGQRRFSLGFCTANILVHAGQTCQGESWLYVKSHYSSSAFHQPADNAPRCSITPRSRRNRSESLRSCWEGRGAAGTPPTPPPPLLHPHGAPNPTHAFCLHPRRTCGRADKCQE